MNKSKKPVINDADQRVNAVTEGIKSLLALHRCEVHAQCIIDGQSVTSRVFVTVIPEQPLAEMK